MHAAIANPIATATVELSEGATPSPLRHGRLMQHRPVSLDYRKRENPLLPWMANSLCSLVMNESEAAKVTRCAVHRFVVEASLKLQSYLIEALVVLNRAFSVLKM